MSTFYSDDMYGKKSGAGLKIAGILGVCAVLAGGCAAAYAFSDTVKNQVKLAFSKPEDYFTWVYEKNTSDLADACGASYQKSIDQKNEGATGYAELRLEPTEEIRNYIIDDALSIDSDSSDEERELADIIQKTDSIAFRVDSTVLKNSFSEKLTLLRNGETLTDADVIMDLDNNYAYGRVADLTERYIGMDIQKASEELLNGSDLLFNPKDVPTGQEIGECVKKYCMIPVENITEVTIEKKKPVQISGISTEYTAMTANLTAEQVLDIAQKFTDSASTDETLKKLIPDQADFQNAMLEAGDSIRQLRESGISGTTNVQMITYVDTTGTIRGHYITAGSDFGYFGAIGMEDNQIAGELKVSAAGKSLLSCKLDATRDGMTLNGTASAFVNNTYGDEDNEIKADFSNFKIVDAEKGYFSGDVKLTTNDEEIPEIALTFNSDGSSESISYQLNVEEYSVGLLTLTYSADKGGSVEVPDRSGVFEVSPDMRGVDIEQYVSKDEIKKFSETVLKRLGVSDKLIGEVNDSVDGLY
ncbi:MAG: hypothetical protein IKQ91_01615 [Oscillospiraceae bacterium]|nr:hypothetical protein [Oscillospiraceae bacterium]